MKGDRMKKSMADRRMGVILAAMIFLFMLTTAAQVEARQASLKTQLRNSGISMKLVRLDRTDGFMFGLSFTGPKKQSIVIAPGLDRMILVLTGGQEMILQANGTGNMQIIQATDGTYVLCVLTAMNSFLTNWSTCQGDTVCLLTSIVTLVTDILNCGSGTTS